MPPELRNRAADNWRVLLAIADACSPWAPRFARDTRQFLDRKRSVTGIGAMPVPIAVAPRFTSRNNAAASRSRSMSSFTVV